MAYRFLCIWPVFTFSASRISQILSSLTDHITLQPRSSTQHAVLQVFQCLLLPQGPCTSWSLYLRWVSLLYNHPEHLHSYSNFSDGAWRKAPCCIYASTYHDVWHGLGTQ